MADAKKMHRPKAPSVWWVTFGPVQIYSGMVIPCTALIAFYDPWRLNSQPVPYTQSVRRLLTTAKRSATASGSQR